MRSRDARVKTNGVITGGSEVQFAHQLTVYAARQWICSP
jgi:hypothetical protein